MRIFNETHWRTDQISNLIYRVAQDELDSGQLKSARITLRYRRQRHMIGGNCVLGSHRNPRVIMTLLLPRETEIDKVDLALTIAHELAHAKGMQHREMNKSNRYSAQQEGWRERYDYALLFPIEVRPEPIKLSREEALQQRRTEAMLHAQAMVSKWTTAAKKADTHLKKWRVRLKAAERRVKQPPLLRPKSHSPSLPPTEGERTLAASASF